MLKPDLELSYTNNCFVMVENSQVQLCDGTQSSSMSCIPSHTGINGGINDNILWRATMYRPCQLEEDYYLKRDSTRHASSWKKNNLEAQAMSRKKLKTHCQKISSLIIPAMDIVWPGKQQICFWSCQLLNVTNISHIQSSHVKIGCTFLTGDLSH